MIMAVPAIALCASPLCSSPYQCQINSSSLDIDFNSRSPPSIGYISSSSPKSDDFGYLKRDHGSVSVIRSPVSCSSSTSNGVKSLPIRIGRENSNRSPRSYVDFDSTCLRSSQPSVMIDELPFDIDLTSGLCVDLLYGAQTRHKIFHDELVVKAFYEAEKAHRGQKRASGEPYLQHCVETAVMLAKIGANSTVVAVGLLHDTLDDSSVTYEYIFRVFGAGVADLVRGVSKLSQLSKLARESNTACKIAEADRLHTMVLAMADARAVLIKLADRLHNMMTLDALPLLKQQRIAKETLEIFAPLANRLGISTWKEQLENLCFKYLYPDQYRDLTSKLANSLEEEMITSAVEKLEGALKEADILFHVLSGRHKSLFSIYTKMLKKHLTMDEIHDIHGLRLIVEKEEDCYEALSLVHQLWPQVPGRFKNYISHPKFNGYQSLHTVVMSEGMEPLEVQIRTKEMHLQAEYGFAAHWRYKEGDCQHSSFVLQMVEWARWVITWQCEATSYDQSTVGNLDSMRPPCAFPSHSKDCPFSYVQTCSADGPVFVVMMENEKMSVQEFPENSTFLDLLERASKGNHRWTPYGFPLKKELRPRLNHKPVSDLTCKLKMGDMIELTPAIPNKSLTTYREEIKRMYDSGLTTTVSGSSYGANNVVGWTR